MIVSQFLLKNDTYGKISKEYVLLITNLSPKAYNLRAYFHCRFFQLHHKAHVYVNGETSSMLTGLKKVDDFLFRTDYNMTVFPQETVMMRLLTTEVGGRGETTDNVDTMGYVELEIPTMYREWDKTQVAQGDSPVKFLLHAYSQDFNLTSFQHDYSPITLSTGQAEVEIMPAQPRSRFTEPISFVDLKDLIQAKIEQNQDALADPIIALAGTLSTLHDAAETPDGETRLNRLLSEAELPFQIVRRRQ